MAAQLALCQLSRIDLDGGDIEHAGLFALAAACALVGMHRGQEHGVLAGTLVVLKHQRDGLVDQRTDAVADVASQAEEIEAGFMVHQNRETFKTDFQISVDAARGISTGISAGSPILPKASTCSWK